MKILTVGLVGLLLSGASVGFAADDKCGDKCGTGECCGACSADKEAAIAVAMAKLPKIEYRVGEETLCCEGSATAKAKSTGEKLVYVVAEAKYDSADNAFDGLVEQTEKFVADFTTPVTCKESGNTTIAGQSLCCSVKAEEVAVKVKKAMDGVSLAYKVGDKVCSCPVEAQTLADTKNVKKIYLIGKEETECEKTARLKLARAKYKAALIAALDEPAKSETDAKGGQ